MLKLTDNPPMFPDGTVSVADLAGRWWVAHTKSRFEKAFAWDLLRRGTGYFLPLIERVRVSGGRKRRVLLPLFPGYVFLCGTEDDRQAAMATNRLCQTIYVADQGCLRGELVSIEKALKGNAVLDPYPFAVAGRRCRIVAGPFLGVEGVVVERSRLARLVLSVDALGQSVSMEIHADLLEPMD